jgi:hypothetical protein
MASRTVISALAMLAAVSAACARGDGAADPSASAGASRGTSTTAQPATPRDKTLAEAEDELAARVREVVVAQRARLRACYEAGLAQTPTLAGRVVLVVEVAQNGMASHVYEAHREGLGPDEVKCFARVLKSTRFHDGAASAVKLQVPLSFTPAAE